MHAALGFALEQLQEEPPNIGYAAGLPIATVTRVITSQLILTLLL